MYYMDVELSKFVRDEMNKRNWSQSESVRRSGVSHPTISYLLSGTFKTSEATLTGIVKAFNMSAEKLFQVADVLPCESNRT